VKEQVDPQDARACVTIETKKIIQTTHQHNISISVMHANVSSILGGKDVMNAREREFFISRGARARALVTREERTKATSESVVYACDR
jgi:hypothetical protein